MNWSRRCCTGNSRWGFSRARMWIRVRQIELSVLVPTVRWGCKGHAKRSRFLKNEDQLLPLNPDKLKTIAVIGPNADRELLGGYSGKPNYFNSVLEGIRAEGNGKIKV